MPRKIVPSSGEKANPPIQVPSTAGKPASSASPAKVSKGGVARDRSSSVRRFGNQRRGDPDAFGDVVQDKADHQERAQCRFTQRKGRANRQPFAKIVQANREGDQGRQECALRADRTRCFVAPVLHGADRHNRQPGQQRGKQGQRHPLEHPRQLRPDFQNFQEGIDQQEDQQPNRQRQDEPQPLAPHALHGRVPEQPERHRDHAHINTQQPIAGKFTQPGLGVSVATGTSPSKVMPVLVTSWIRCGSA